MKAHLKEKLDILPMQPGCYIFKDENKNILYVAQGDDNEYLLSDRAIIRNINWINKEKPLGDIKVGVKFRYRQKDQGCTLEFIDEETVKLTYDEPYKQRKKRQPQWTQPI